MFSGLGRASPRIPPHSCKSSLSVPSRHAIAPTRRVTVPSVQYPLGATVGFSAAIVFAATYDVRIKRKRRKQWDDCIQTLRAELEDEQPMTVTGPAKEKSRALRQDRPLRKPATRIDPAPVSLTSKKANRIHDNSDPSSTALASKWKAQHAKVIERHQLKSLGQMAGWSEDDRIKDVRVKELEKMVLRSLHRPHETLSALRTKDFEFQWLHERRDRVWTPKTILVLELSMAKLVASLSMEASSNINGVQDGIMQELFDGVEVEGPNGLQTRVDSLSQALVEAKQTLHYDLHKIPPPFLPQYSHVEDDPTFRLNHLMESIFSQVSEGTVSYGSALAHAAHILLTTPAPPHISTLTILVSRLSRGHHFVAADNVIDAVAESNIGIDKQFTSTVLNHYIRNKDGKAFELFVKRVHGYYGGFLVASHAHCHSYHLSSKQRKLWRGKTHNILDKDLTVYKSLVKGYLKFGRFKEALFYYKEMRKNGIDPDLTILNLLLDYFAKIKQWNLGLGMWRRIHAQYLRQDDPCYSSSKEQKTAFACMLRLCVNCGKLDEHEAIRREANLRSFHMENTVQKTSLTYNDIFFGDVVQRLSNEIESIERKAQLHIHDFRLWAMEVLASKIVLSGEGHKILESLTSQESLERPAMIAL